MTRLLTLFFLFDLASFFLSFKAFLPARRSGTGFFFKLWSSRPSYGSVPRDILRPSLYRVRGFNRTKLGGNDSHLLSVNPFHREESLFLYLHLDSLGEGIEDGVGVSQASLRVLP